MPDKKDRDETGVSLFKNLATEQILLQRETAQIFTHASGAVVSVATSLKTCELVRTVYTVHDEHREKSEQADGSEEDCSTSAEKEVEKMRGLLAKSRYGLLQYIKNCEEALAVGRGRSDSGNAQVADLAGQVLKTERLFCISCSKDRMDLSKARKLVKERRTVLLSLCISCSKLPGF